MTKKELEKRIEELEKDTGNLEDTIEMLKDKLRIVDIQTKDFFAKKNKKQHHEFKVGDRVQFKSWKEMEQEFGKVLLNGTPCINIHPTFAPSMKYLCKEFATISELEEDGFVQLKDFSVQNEDNKSYSYSINMLKPATDEPRWTFTDDEKVILRNLLKKYRWIARDECGDLVVYTKKPKKIDFMWYSGRGTGSVALDSFGCLFKSIKVNDDEPCEFRKYI